MSGGNPRGAGVETLLRPERGEAAAVLAASHADYPGFAWLWPDPAVRRRALRPFLRATVADVAAHGSAAVGRDGQGVCAVALWLPPGSFPWSLGRKLRAAPALARTAMAAPRAFPAFAALGASAERTHPDEEHWSLEVLGVHPRAQGEGWGGELMRAGIARADADGAACWVETSDPANVGFYRALGFEVLAPRLEHLAGGPRYVGLRRPPRH